MTKYPSLYNIARRKNVTVAHVLSIVSLSISFRRTMVGENRVKWLKLVGILLEVQLNMRRDTFV
jgi:hypothetical protein